MSLGACLSNITPIEPGTRVCLTLPNAGKIIGCNCCFIYQGNLERKTRRTIRLFYLDCHIQKPGTVLANLANYCVHQLAGSDAKI